MPPFICHIDCRHCHILLFRCYHLFRYAIAATGHFERRHYLLRFAFADYAEYFAIDSAIAAYFRLFFAFRH